MQYDAHKDGLYASCQRRCEEVRDEYQHTVVFLLMVLGKIVHSGAHPHRQLPLKHISLLIALTVRSLWY